MYLKLNTLVYGKEIKRLSSKQMLQIFSIALALVQTCNISGNLRNEICQIIHSLYQVKKITKKVNNNIANSINLWNRMDSIFLNFENSKNLNHILNLANNIDLKISDKYITLSNLSMFYSWESVKKPYKKK